MTAALDANIRAVLSRIHDPCSVAAGRPLSVLDMGLVLGWSLGGGTLTVRFCVTFAGCTMSPHFTGAAERDLLGVEGVERVVTEVDTTHAWPGLPRQPMHGEPQAWRRRAPAASDGFPPKKPLSFTNFTG